MSDLLDNKNQSSSNFRQLLQERFEKANPRRELSAEEAKRLSKLEAKKNERANALKEVKRLCKEFGFTAGMLKGALVKGRGEK